MREILFRGKAICGNRCGTWIFGFYVNGFWHENENEHGILPTFDKDRGGYYEVNPETVGQYTGLKDKNGKRIFEGDIIKYADMLDYNCYLESLECPEDYEGCDYSDIFTVDEVVYCDNVDYPAFDLNKHDFESNGLSELIASYQYHYEVIGNIHDNPELLESK